MLKGIDVAYVQGTIDWEHVKPQIGFAIVRAGYGQGNIDAQAVRNLSECNRLGIPVGVFWFSYALNEEMVRREAQYILDFVKDYRIELPIFYDFEYDSVRYAQDNGVTVSNAMISTFNDVFCTVVRTAGYYPAIYANSDYINNILAPALLGKYDLWYAHYDIAELDHACNIWQYTDALRIDGIENDVDGDYCYVDYPAIIRSAGLNNLGGEPSMTVEEAKAIVKQKAGLTDATIQYIADDYRYGNELIVKLANAMK